MNKVIGNNRNKLWSKGKGPGGHLPSYGKPCRYKWGKEMRERVVNLPYYIYSTFSDPIRFLLYLK